MSKFLSQFNSDLNEASAKIGSGETVVSTSKVGARSGKKYDLTITKKGNSFVVYIDGEKLDDNFKSEKEANTGAKQFISLLGESTSNMTKTFKDFIKIDEAENVTNMILMKPNSRPIPVINDLINLLVKNVNTSKYKIASNTDIKNAVNTVINVDGKKILDDWAAKTNGANTSKGTGGRATTIVNAKSEVLEINMAISFFIPGGKMTIEAYVEVPFKTNKFAG